MASVPAAPIRQPRGPTTAGFGRPSSPVNGSSAPGSANVNAQSGPPAADTDSTLRRNRTVGSGQSGRYGHATSASLGAAALGYSAAGAGGARTGTGSGGNASTDGGPKYKESRFRSGSLSSQHSASSDGQSGVVRRTSTRERPESRSGVQEVVHEDKDLESPVGGLEGGWGKGLARQSSLPSRRVHNASMSSIPPVPTMIAPPRPPRRISDQSVAKSAAPASALSPAHSHTHSLGSIASLTRLGAAQDSMPPPPVPSAAQAAQAAGVSRTQSLRNQARNAAGNLYGLGRSTSLRQAGEHSHHRATQSIATPGSASSHTLDLASPITNPASPKSPFTPPSPPPQSSTAALPPFQMPVAGGEYDGRTPAGLNGGGVGQGGGNGGADVKRHQSLGHQYGRLRDRLDRAPALLSLDQRGNAVGGNSIVRPSSGANGSNSAEAPPTSPLYNSVWSPQQTPGDDGWTRSIQGVSEALAGMNVSGPGGAGYGGISGAQLQQQMGMEQGRRIVTNGTEEPAWVASLVGGKEGSPNGMARAPSAPVGGQVFGQQQQQQGQNQPGFAGTRWPDGQGYIPLEYLQQQQQAQLLSLASADYGGQPQLQTQLQMQMQGHEQGPGGFKLPQLNFNAQGGGYMQQPGSAQGFQMPLMGNMGNMPMMGMPPITPNTPFGYPHSPNPHTPVPTAHHFGPQDQAVIELARAKGLNPATFDCQPPVARFFVIKSYTEEDVQKSLKHEIWSSTVLGNRRLNSAFKESADKGPIYLFFSVNGSRHFCGVAEMLTEVDETQDSKVWTQDKWKGIFKVKWIFVRDVPSAALRHIRLIHTPEQKPITNSRDTQELHYEAGCEMLQIFLEFQNKSKTSLLQDFAYYESLSEARSQNATPAGTPHPGSSNPSNTSDPSPGQIQAQQGMLPNQPVPMMPPMLQMPVPMQYGGPTLGVPYGHGQGQGQQQHQQQQGQGQGRMPSPHGPGPQYNQGPHQQYQQQQQQHQYQQGGRGMRAPPVPPIPARFR